MSKTLRFSLTLALCVLLFACLLPAAYADDLQDLQAAIADGSRSFEFTVDTAIPAGTVIDASGLMLRVPVGVTLTVEGKLTVGDFWLDIDAGTGRWGKFAVAEGGELHMTKAREIPNVFWDEWLENGTASRLSFEADAELILARGVGSAGMDYDGLARAVSDAQRYLSENEHLLFHIAIDGDTALDGLDTSITLPERVILSVEGELWLDRFYDNGIVIVGENGFLYVQSEFRIGENVTVGMFTLNGELSVEHDALIPEQLEVLTLGDDGLIDISFDCRAKEAALEELNAPTALFPHFCRSIWVFFPWELEDNLALPEQVRLGFIQMEGTDGRLVIPAGKTLTIPESSELYTYVEPEDADAAIQLNGSIVNNGLINLGEPGDRPGAIVLGPNASYSGTGEITCLGYPCVLDDPAWTGLAAACAKSYSEFTEYWIEDAHCFTVPAEGLTIPENLSVNAPECLFIVPKNAALTISAGAEMNVAGLDCAGTVSMGGAISLSDTLLIGEEPIHVTGTLLLSLDAWLTVWDDIRAEGPDDVAAKFSFESENALVNIVVIMEEDEIAASLDYPMFHIPHFRESLILKYPWTLDHDRVLEADAVLVVLNDEKSAGVLTIPDGMSLTIPERSALMISGSGPDAQDPAIVRIQGLLINAGKIHFDDESSIALLDRGIYAGDGEVLLESETGHAPCVIWNNPQSADLLLPRDLTTLEAEALAGESYGSVCIPAGTTSIAPDAFGDRDRLIIFGTPLSAADVFAHEHGFLFAPVE